MNFSRKDSMQRHMSSKHSTSGFPPFQALSVSPVKCQRFHLGHPFTCMVAGMTGSGKTVWVKSLLQQAHKTMHPTPERIVWCYSQWQPAYRELLLTIPGIEFIKGIPSTLEQDSFFDVNIRNLIVIDDQMIEAGSDNWIVNLFTKGSHHRNLSVVTLCKTYSIKAKYEVAVRGPFGYLFIDLKPTTQDSCRLRTNVLPGEERFDNGEVEGSISKELLQYLKQQNLMAAPVIPEMQRLRNNMDGLQSRNDLREDENARQYMQLQNRFLTYKHQLNSIPEATKWAEPQEKKQISTTENLPTVPTPSPKLATVPATPVQAPDPQVITSMATSTPLPPSPPPSILTPPTTVEMSPPKKRKRPQIRLVNYLDDKPKRPSRQSRRLHRTSP
ncbi:hypothetical protein ACROYT_G035124 [Oculina patagonica]